MDAAPTAARPGVFPVLVPLCSYVGLTTHLREVIGLSDRDVLPGTARAAAESLALWAPLGGLDEATRERLQQLRLATEQRQKLRVVYLDLGGTASERVLRPLGCFFWGPVWTFAAWCELREGFRNFRVDRIQQLEVMEERFRDEPGKTLADMQRAEGWP